VKNILVLNIIKEDKKREKKEFFSFSLSSSLLIRTWWKRSYIWKSK